MSKTFFFVIAIIVAILFATVDAKKQQQQQQHLPLYQSFGSSASTTSTNGLKVAATQFFPSTTGATPFANIQQTASRAIQFIFQTLAQQNYQLDLMVFPEFLFLGDLAAGLGKSGVCSDDGTNSSGKLREYCYRVPDAGDFLPCGGNSPDSHSPAALVGCALANSTMTLSINVCELMPNNGTLYNTQVLIRNGIVVAKYRKYHPFFTKCFSKPNLELVTFNVTASASGQNYLFGVFTCFDILFKDPKMDLVAMGVKYFSYSIAIPLVGIEAVKLFSYENKVTVVNSNADAGQTGVVVDGKTVIGCPNKKESCAAVYTL